MLFVIPACHKTPRNDNPPVLTPEITSFSPVHGTPGTVVTISGKNFKTVRENNLVSFGGASTSVTAASATQLTVTVPAAAVTGRIKVNSATSASDFTVDAAAASISDFAPKQGPFGTEVTITGRLFGNDPVVKLNGITADIKQRSATQIVIIIPTNTALTSHKISVQFGSTVLETATPFTIEVSGPSAEWVSWNVAEMPVPFFQLGLGFAYQNKLYWGFTRISIAQTTADYFVFDPAAPAKGWVLQPPPPADMAPAVLQNATAVILDNKLYMGTGLRPTASQKWWRYDPGTNTATAFADYPESTSGALSFVLNNVIYVGFGGTLKTLYKFNETGNGSWQPAVTGTFRELTGAAAVVLGDDVYLGRALLAAGGPRKAMFKFTPPDRLVQVTDMPEETVLHSTPSFTIGGKGYFVVDKRVWEYTPNATGGSWRVVIGTPDGPSIAYTGVVNNVVFGWTGTGAVYEFKFQ